MRHPTTNSSRRSPKAVILLAVLVVVVLLTLAAYQYSELVTAEYRAADSYERSGKAKAYAASGVHYVAAIVGNSNNFTSQVNGNPHDNPTAFQGKIVASSDDPRKQGRFSIVSPLGPDDTASGTNPFRYGVTDESGKININALMKLDSSGQIAHDVLINLPNMTEEIANCILDWIDPDDNRNGILDPGEDDGTGVVNQGWSAYLTVYSRELNLAGDGTPRIYVNDSDLNTLNTNLQSILGSDLANFIIAYRLYGAAQTGTGQVTSSAADRSRALQKMTTDLQNSQQMRLPPGIGSLFDLINSNVDVTIPATAPLQPPVKVRFPSPLKDAGTLRQLLPILLDKVTTVRSANSSEIPARVNVNTAPRAVLAALPGLADTDVQTIIDHRPSMTTPDAGDPIFQTPAWLITEANFPPATLKTLERYVTASSVVYRIQSIGYFDGGGPTARIEAVIDANNQRPRIVSWRDLTELGKGFDIGSR